MDETDSCPLCRGPNQCGASAGVAECWCFSAVIPQEVLDRIPAEERNRACVCARCASGAGGNAVAGSGQADGGDGI